MNSLKEKMLETELTDQQLGIFYLGQVGFLLKYRKCYFLIDGEYKIVKEKGHGISCSLIKSIICSCDHASTAPSMAIS